VLEGYKDMRAAAEAIDATYNDMRYLMPVQRYFHKSRLSQFRCIEFADAAKISPNESGVKAVFAADYCAAYFERAEIHRLLRFDKDLVGIRLNQSAIDYIF